MLENRTIAACILLSILAHLTALMMASFVPWTGRKAESVMVVDLADLPRSTDFFPPKPGVIKGGPPPPEKRSKQAATKLPAPRMMTGRVPDLPVNPALTPEENFPPAKAKEASPPPTSLESPKPTAPHAGEKAEPAGKTVASAPAAPGTSGGGGPLASKSPGGPSQHETGGSGKPLKDLSPSLGKMVLAMGKIDGRGTGETSGNTVGTGGKTGDKGGIVEEGGGARLTALNAPEIQYISYFAGIKRKIELVWGYPAGAAGIEGDVIADFVIGRSGRLESVTLVRGSGNRILDDEALGAIRKASPYAPIPSDYKIANLQIRAHFYYTVTQTRILR